MQYSYFTVNPITPRDSSFMQLLFVVSVEQSSRTAGRRCCIGCDSEIKGL